MITCSEAVRQLWEHLGGQLSDDRHRQVQAHLDLCRRCCGEAEFTAALQGLLRSAVVCELPQESEQHLLAFLDDLEEEPT